MKRVVICICTYRRPAGLERLLEALRELKHDVNLQIVVADNDIDKEGIQVVNDLDADYPYPVHTISETVPGISAARNGASNTALGLQPELIAFLDDDEWPEPQWLEELMRVQQRCNADAVGGPTKPVFPADAPRHLLSNGYYGADLQQKDGSRCELQAAGNFLIRATVLQRYAPEFFHPSFAHSGGEDLAFFTQLAKDGYVMAWASNAIVHESVPQNRLADEWLENRVVNIHNSRVRVMQLLQPGIRPAAIRGAKTVALGVVAALYSALALTLPGHAEKARLLRWKFRGKLSAHLGRHTVRGETY